jgi:HlyD family secretion protein
MMFGGAGDVKQKMLVWLGIVLFIGSTTTADYTYMEKLKKASHVKTVNVETKTIKETLTASGKIVPTQIEHIYRDPSKGTMKEVLVEEGQEVKQGTSLIQYTDEETDQQLQRFELKKQRVNMQIDHWNEQLDDLEQRTNNADEEDFSPTAIQQMESKQEDMSFQIKMANHEMREIDMQIDQLRQKEEKLMITSNITGIVSSVKENTAPNEPVITIVSNVFEIEGTLSEYDAVVVEKGQEVTITAKALPDENWSGEISEISSIPAPNDISPEDAEQQVTTYPFSVTFAENPDESMKQGYHMNLEIVVSKHESALVLPAHAIINQDAEEYIFVVKEGKLERRNIETGLVNGKWKEITNGMKKGETVVLAPSDDLYDGMEVTVDQHIDTLENEKSTDDSTDASEEDQVYN